MTPEQLDQLYIDSLYYSVNSRLPKSREQVYGELVAQAKLKEVKAKWNEIDGHTTDDTYLRIEFEDWLDQQLKEA